MATDYDVVIIGGGINGLCSAAYLAKAGIQVAVVEARGECGTHCDSAEPCIPGYVFNLHATMLAPGFGPPMEDLDLERFGLELRNTDYIWGKSFSDGKNALIGVNPYDTIESWAKHDKHDASLLESAIEWLYPNMLDFTALMHQFMYQAPSRSIMDRFTDFMHTFLTHLKIPCTGQEFMRLNGFEVLERLFRSDHLKTMIQAMAWIVGFPPIHPQIGAIGILMGLLSGSFYPLTTAKGGSHALTHSLIRCAVHHGATIYNCCPVEQIQLKEGRAHSIRLSPHAIYPNEVITAKKIISDLTVVPTFCDLVGTDQIDTTLAAKIKQFDYAEQTIFTVHYALCGQPRWASADYDEGILRCWMGYFGGENTSQMKQFAKTLLKGEIHGEILANWYTPTLADPTQAPSGCHVTQAWVDIPGAPKRWSRGSLDGFDAWDAIKNQLADQITDTYERYAPGFKNLLLDRYIYTPLGQYRNNPSAIMGNWAGGSVIPSQFYDKRPVPGVLRKGGSRTFIDDLYLSNSIHPLGISTLSCGYITACEVAEDLGVRQQNWWSSKATHWYLKNANKIPLNLGVGGAT